LICPFIRDKVKYFLMSIKENIERVRENVERACLKSGRKPESVKILGATKDVPASKIREAFYSGLRIFGENRVQEAISKISELKDLDIEWHMIGNLQRNKVKKALDIFHLIESVSSLKLAEEINKEAGKRNIIVKGFVEVNIGREASKSGFLEEELMQSLDKLSTLPNLEIFGLMTIPPYSTNPEDSRKYFVKLRELADKVNSLKTRIFIKELSMGMSSDYTVAVEEGATIVRIGTAIFGERVKCSK